MPVPRFEGNRAIALTNENVETSKEVACSIQRSPTRRFRGSFMPDQTPWLTTIRGLDGTKWAPSDGKPNPKIQSWLGDIGAAYPNMAAYCNSVVNDDYLSWCGLTVAYCMATAKIAPVFGTTDLTRFLYAAAWLGWGSTVTTPQQGDVIVFDFGGGDHHVTLFEKDNGDGTWSCHGGNQSHEVNLTNFPKRSLMGIRRPSLAAVQQLVAVAGAPAPGAEGRVVTALQTALAAQGFDPGGIDGEFGPLTSAAISKFQRAHNLPVTGSADPATLQALRVSTDGGPQINVATGEPTMQLQDLLKTVIDALITKQPGTIPTPTAAPAQGQVDITQVLQIAIAALAGKPLPVQPAAGAGSAITVGAVTGTTAPPVLSVIDQIFGGEALAGKKTMLAVIAYVVLAILQAAGVAGTATGTTATPTGEILTTLIGAFGALGGLAKVDRLTQTLGLIAKQPTPPLK
jgi:uncharacterized protein (TIGR02594 family)